MSNGKLILLRHGQSAWNASNQFTGWVDVNLTTIGEAEAKRGGELLVGAAQHPPFVEAVDREQPTGSEVELIEQYAQHHDATITWETGSETVLVGMLADGKLDVVIGGFDDKTTWSKEAAPTRPYATEADGTKRVMLTEPGENTLLVDLEIFLMEQAGERR